MRFLFCLCIGLSTTNTILAADASIDRPAVHQAVGKSIAWLEKDMSTWRDDHGCAACHHGPMYLWSVSVAKRQGYEVNVPQWEEFTRWLLTDDEARIFLKTANAAQEISTKSNASDRMTTAMMGHKNLSQPTIYLTHAIIALPDREPLKKIGWQKVIDHLAAAQKEDGSFAGRNAWRPIFNTPQILTRFVVSGIRDAGGSTAMGSVLEKQSRILKNSDTFLASQDPDETHQGLVLRLLQLPQLQKSSPDDGRSAERSRLVRQLTKLQRSDGGWSQTEDRDSDAFATGQTLAALHRAGLNSDNSAVHKGIDFLLRTQTPDGTWPMNSRPNPETGKPAELLNPITYAATAWAVLGLATQVPRKLP